jgi:hypothetical protein
LDIGFGVFEFPSVSGSLSVSESNGFALIAAACRKNLVDTDTDADPDSFELILALLQNQWVDTARLLSCQNVRCLQKAMQRCRRRQAGMIAMVNGTAVLDYGNHLPSSHEPPLRFAVRTTIPDKGENDIFVQDSLIPFMPDKNAEVVLIRAPPVRN